MPVSVTLGLVEQAAREGRGPGSKNSIVSSFSCQLWGEDKGALKGMGGWLKLVLLQPTLPFPAWRRLSPSAKSPSAKQVLTKPQAKFLQSRTHSMQVLLSHSQEGSGLWNGGEYINSLGREVFGKGLTPLSRSSFCLPLPSFLRQVS